jgi:hypothetical protein
MRRYLWVFPILLAALLAACGGEPTATPLVVADLFATPGRALATIALSPTPSPTATIPHFPSPTPQPTLPLPTSMARQPTLPIGTANPLMLLEGTPSPMPLDCEGPPEPFALIWQRNGTAQQLLGCPAGGPQDVALVYQPYEHGHMFWRESDLSVFVLSDNAIRQGQPTDTWWRLEDTFREGEPESDPSLQAPSGLLQPIRGFGKIWRQNGFVREALGWATAPETYYVSRWQFFERGWMMTGLNEAVFFVMIPSDEPSQSSGMHMGALAP